MAKSSPSEQQPEYGKRLLPCVFDEEARFNPDRIFATYARSNDLKDGFQDVTFSQLAQAVDAMAHYLQSAFEAPKKHSFETLTYFGILDIRYNIVFYAAVKCGYKVALISSSQSVATDEVQVFLPSARSPASTNNMLMQRIQSTKVLYAKELETIVREVVALGEGIDSVSIESAETLLKTQSDPFPFHPTFEESIRDPIVVLHSSGSTGLPKTIIMTHGTFATMDNDRGLSNIPGRKTLGMAMWDFGGPPSRFYEPFPPTHLSGFCNNILAPLYTNGIPVFGPPLAVPNSRMIANIIQQQAVRGCALMPTLAEQILSETNGLDLFKRLDIFCYGGGPLSREVGDKISSVTNVCQFYGSTELGIIQQLMPLREDWAYMEFHPDLKIEFQPFDTDCSELVIYADSSTESTSALNHNYPGVPEWHTKDLFIPHPAKKGLWKFYGRKDDFVVLSNNEKFNPVPMEDALQSLSTVSAALVVGQGRSMPALLIQPRAKESSVECDIGVDEVWPTIEAANASMPLVGRISRTMVRLAGPHKHFVRAGKGTVIRKLTEAAFVDEIEELYGNSHRSS